LFAQTGVQREPARLPEPSRLLEPQRLSPDETVEMAIRNNLSLESARLSASMSERASKHSWNQFIPTVDVGGAFLHLNESSDMTMTLPPEFGGGKITIPGGSQWRVAGSLSVSLNINVAMFEDMKKLRLDYEKGFISYGKARSQLERDVRKAYHNMLLLQENIALLKGSFENAERQVQIAQANYRAGLAPELTLLQAQVARENLRPVIDQAEAGFKLAMMQFSMYLGMDSDMPFEFIPVTEDASYISLDVSELIRKAASGRPDIQELRHDILSLGRLRKSTAYKLYTPTLSLSWSADPTFSGDPWKDAWFEDMDKWRQQSGNFRFSLGFRLNGLLPFGSERQGLKTLDEQIKTANIGLSQLIQGTEIEIYNTVLSLERTRITAEALAQTVNLAERAYRLTEEAYRAGFQDLFQVQSAEQSLRQARVQMLEQQFNYLNGLIDLEYSIGVPFGTLNSTAKNNN
jgi:outer membrane protein TolC